MKITRKHNYLVNVLMITVNFIIDFDYVNENEASCWSRQYYLFEPSLSSMTSWSF